VIIRGATDNTQFRALSTRTSLLHMFEDAVVQLSTANTYSYHKGAGRALPPPHEYTYSVSCTFGEYVEKHLRPQQADKRGNGM
jgi:hypothetical protein